jgi:DNA-binding Lrp family transcriptional regulator
MRQSPLSPAQLDQTDRIIINRLQDGLPLTSHPFARLSQELGLDEETVVGRLKHLRDIGAVTRFGPFYDAEAMGGNFFLCAMEVPKGRFDQVMTLVNAHPEVAHNYERDHRLNMWFVVASDTPQGTKEVVRKIEKETGLRVLQLPKLKEFYIGLRVDA